MKPRARANMIVRPIGDEVVVYDPATHTAHCLNRTAAVVLGAADGRTSVPALAARLAAETGSDVPDEVVWTTLERLAEAKLLTAPLPVREAEPSRRRVLRRVGLGAAVLTPAVASLLVPTPAEALNTCIPAASCTPSNQFQPCWVTSQSLECPTKQCNGGSGATACTSI